MYLIFFCFLRINFPTCFGFSSFLLALLTFSCGCVLALNEPALCTFICSGHVFGDDVQVSIFIFNELLFLMSATSFNCPRIQLLPEFFSDTLHPQVLRPMFG